MKKVSVQLAFFPHRIFVSMFFPAQKDGPKAVFFIFIPLPEFLLFCPLNAT